MAAHLLTRELGARSRHVDVRSAGLLESGRLPAPETVEVMRSFGVDMSEHRSRTLTADLVRAADLVIGMERRHVIEAVVIAPEAFSRSFLLTELVRGAAEIGSRRREALRPWLARMHEGRSTGSFLAGAAEEIADPYGLSPEAYAETAAELDELIRELVPLAWP